MLDEFLLPALRRVSELHAYAKFEHPLTSPTMMMGYNTELGLNTIAVVPRVMGCMPTLSRFRREDASARTRALWVARDTTSPDRASMYAGMSSGNDASLSRLDSRPGRALVGDRKLGARQNDWANWVPSCIPPLALNNLQHSREPSTPKSSTACPTASTL